MPLMFRFLLALLPFVLNTNGEDATDGDDESPNDDGDDRDDVAGDELGEKGKAALKAERDARRKAEADAKALKERLDKIEADARKEADEKAKKQGEWQELAEKRDADLTEATSKLTNATTELESLRTYVTADVEAVAKTVRDAAKDVPAAKILMEFHPGDDASTADLITWTKRAKAQLPELTATESKRPGNGPNPNPSDGNDDAEVESPISKRQILG